MKFCRSLCELLIIFGSLVNSSCATKNIKYGWIPIENQKYKSLENFNATFNASVGLSEHHLKRKNYHLYNETSNFKLLTKNFTSNSQTVTKDSYKNLSKKSSKRKSSTARKFKRSNYSKRNLTFEKRNETIQQNYHDTKKVHIVQNFSVNQVNNQGSLKPVIGANSNCFNKKKEGIKSFSCHTKVNRTKAYTHGFKALKHEGKACKTRNKLIEILDFNKVPRRWITEVTTIMKNHQMSLLILPDEQEFLMHEGKSLIGFIGDTNIFYDDQMEIVKIAHITID